MSPPATAVPPNAASNVVLSGLARALVQHKLIRLDQAVEVQKKADLAKTKFIDQLSAGGPVTPIRLAHFAAETFGLPLNLHLIGTMNTADRSIALIDTALRRRFDFIAMDPKPEILDSRTYVGDVQPSDFLRALNTKLAGVFRDREHAIGHAWFMPDGEKPQTQAQVLKAFKDKVVPTLTEWLWDSPEKLREILGDDVVDEYGKVDPAKLTDKCLADMVGNATKPSAAS